MRKFLAGLALLSSLSACTGPSGDEAGLHSLTDQEVALAKSVAEEAIRDADADVSSASVTVRAGTRIAGSTGPCTSGRLLFVKLIGTFPNRGTTDHRDPSVTALVIGADAETGTVCYAEEQTGDASPDPDAMAIDLD